MKRSLAITGYGLAMCAAASVAQERPTITVGSKNFTEQDILGELAARLIETHTDLQVVRKFGLGGTGLCHSALVGGELDIYVEYTGTALLNVLKRRPLTDPDEVFQIVSRAYRSAFDLEWLPPIGFNNTYAITVRSDQADAQGWKTISDLAETAAHLTAGFTSEFVERPDGYPGLRRAYGFAFKRCVDLDPGLMYEALAKGQVDVICGFATDGRILAYDLHMLRDDKSFFPPYDAAPVVRAGLLRKYPEVRAALTPLAATIDDRAMQRRNFAVDQLGRSPAEVASEWIDSRAGARLESRTSGAAAPAQISVGQTFESVTRPTGKSVPQGDRYTKRDTLVRDSNLAPAMRSTSFWAMVSRRKAELGQKVVEHLALTGLAMLIAILVGVPTGIGIHRYRASSAIVIGATEVAQTIPSLAMLAFLFAVYGVLGARPAVTALVLYALLPIVLNTFTGLKQVPPELIEAADGLGMSSKQRLWMVELPLALPVIIAGIRTATVWTVGITTLSTYIGAGGLGDFISRGLARNDPRLTLLGALPAALIAVVLSLVIRYFEAMLRPGARR